MKSFLPLLCLVAGLTACGGDAAPDDVIADSFEGLQASHACMEWKGTQRCYYTVAPQEKPTRLIVALHPAFTSVAITENLSHLARKAVPRGYAVVYPEGIDKQWNDGRVMTEVETYNARSDDVGFIDRVTRLSQEKYGLSASQTTVAGMSNGGMMSLRMACQSDRYGTVAAVVANLPVGLRAQCSAAPKPLLVMFGTEDDIVKYGGGALADSGVASEWGAVESAHDTETFFARRNGCEGVPKRTALADAGIDDSRAVFAEYSNCRQPFTAVTVEGMGHTWPGERSRFVAWITGRGAVTQQFEAGDTILRFIESNGANAR